MKDFLFVFLKNLMGAKMGRGFRNFCSNDDSTSTLNQHNNCPYEEDLTSAPSQVRSSSSCMVNDCNSPNVPPRKSVTLEEMILQLELEEEMARKENAARYMYKEEEEEIKSKFHHRMSCVNSSDILRSTRKALNQYPRFSLDGCRTNMDGLKLGRILHLPKSLGGESVVWCKPGVVPKLMGLEAMPMAISKYNYNDDNNSNNNNKRSDKENLCSVIRSQNLRRRAQRNKMERRQKRHVMDSGVCWGSIKRSGRSGGGGGGSSSSCTSTAYCVMNPIAVEPVWGLGGPVSWPSPYNYS